MHFGSALHLVIFFLEELDEILSKIFFIFSRHRVSSFRVWDCSRNHCASPFAPTDSPPRRKNPHPPQAYRQKSPTERMIFSLYFL
jgi:hypothetical protein